MYKKVGNCCKEHRWIIYWVLGITILLGVLCIYFFNTWGIDLIKDGPANFIKDEPNGNGSAVAEVNAFLYFLSGAGAILLALIAYKQIRPIRQTAKAKFLLRIDERWTSKEITEVRQMLWGEYRKAKKKHGKNRYLRGENFNDKQNSKIKELSIDTVGDHIIEIHKNNNLEILFKYLNFMELMGTIYKMKEDGLIEDNLLKNLFGKKLRTYILFYEKYLNDKFPDDPPPAKKLLAHLKKEGS